MEKKLVVCILSSGLGFGLRVRYVRQSGLYRGYMGQWKRTETSIEGLGSLEI